MTNPIQEESLTPTGLLMEGHFHVHWLPGWLLKTSVRCSAVAAGSMAGESSAARPRGQWRKDTWPLGAVTVVTAQLFLVCFSFVQGATHALSLLFSSESHLIAVTCLCEAPDKVLAG